MKPRFQSVSPKLSWCFGCWLSRSAWSAIWLFVLANRRLLNFWSKFPGLIGMQQISARLTLELLTDWLWWTYSFMILVRCYDKLCVPLRSFSVCFIVAGLFLFIHSFIHSTLVLRLSHFCKFAWFIVLLYTVRYFDTWSSVILACGIWCEINDAASLHNCGNILLRLYNWRLHFLLIVSAFIYYFI